MTSLAKINFMNTQEAQELEDTIQKFWTNYEKIKDFTKEQNKNGNNYSWQYYMGLDSVAAYIYPKATEISIYFYLFEQEKLKKETIEEFDFILNYS